MPGGQGHVSKVNTGTAPSVPSASGHHASGTQVDTPSMEVFAKNIKSLIAPAEAASTALKAVRVAPGAFYHANKVRTDVNGPNSDGGLKEKYIKALSDLSQGLLDLHDGVMQLSQKYQTLEKANTMKSTDLQNAMSTTQADFTALMTDTGGSGGVGAKPS